MTTTTTTCTVTTSFMIGTKEVIISSVDFERVMALNWYLWDSYPSSPKVGRLHSFIMGPRPSTVPEDWVVDHKNRNKLDASRQNLRWVSRRFNNWSASRTNTAKYMGVTLFKKTGRLGPSLWKMGYYDTEYEAGYAYAKAAIKEWVWASDSDLLFGEWQTSFDRYWQNWRRR